MKKTVMFGLYIFCRLQVSAQVQEMQQLQLDLEKLAQFKLILSQMKQGYQSLENGYNNVRDAAKGNFNLHKNYLDGLLQVSTAVKHSPGLKQIARDKASAIGSFQQSYLQFQSSGLFVNNELISLKSAYADCMARIKDDNDLLSAILSSGSLRMNDAERLAAIGTIQSDVAVQLSEVQKMVGDFSKLLALRKQQRQDFKTVKNWNGIK